MASDRSVRRERVRELLVAYLVGQGALVIVALLLPRAPAAALLRIVVVVTGTAIFAIGVVRARPRPIAAWGLLVAAAILEVALSLVVADAYGLGNQRDLEALRRPTALVVSVLAMAGIAVGLWLLGRLSPYGGAEEVLDAHMAAVGGFLLIWTFLVEPRLGPGGFAVPAAIVYPVGTLLVFVIMVTLALGGALRDAAVRLLLLALLLRLIASVLAQLPAISAESIETSEWATAYSWAAYGVLLGAAGISLSSAQPHPRERPSSGRLTPVRLAIYVGLAVIAPAAWALELIRHAGEVSSNSLGFTVPAVTSAILLVLLVLRLGLISRVLQSRANELAARSANLSSAVSDLREAQHELFYRATHDSLTGLSNRETMLERLNDWSSRPDDSACHALLLLDLDGFKDVNDTMGHPIGDKLLVEVAHRLRQAAGPHATLARLGGDEFAVLLEYTNADGARHYAETTLSAVRRPYPLAGRELTLSTSVGVLTMDPRPPRPSPSDMLRDADLALYAAKDAGRNTLVFFHPELRHQDRTVGPIG